MAKKWTFQLKVEHEDPVADPSWRQITAAIGGIDAAASDAYAVLDHRNGDFIQVYSCADEYAVELSRTDAQTVVKTLCVAGIPPVLTDTVNIGVLRKHVTVLKGEVLTKDQALTLFRAFHTNRPMPPAFVWRDVWPEIQKLKNNRPEMKQVSPCIVPPLKSSRISESVTQGPRRRRRRQCGCAARNTRTESSRRRKA